MKSLESRIIEIIKGSRVASLATVTEDGKPWVRFVTLSVAEDLTLRLVTSAGSRKVGHIAANPEVHLTAAVGSPGTTTYLQIQGRARTTAARKERRALWKDELKEYFKGPDDPDFVIIVVKPYRIEINTPGSPEPQVWREK